MYSIHYYYPHRYTHWRVSNDTDPVLYYPGQVIDGVTWNQTAMRSSLAVVRDFEQRYGVHIYVGEFSAVRWVSGAAAYLADATALFEEYGWDWTYHAFAEWHGWSIQHDEIKTNTSPSPTQSPRATVLQNLFLLNDRGAPGPP